MASRDEAKRNRITELLARLAKGEATQEDFALMMDKDALSYATAEQCCAFRKIAANSAQPIKAHIIWNWLVIITTRWEQSPSKRKTTSSAPLNADGVSRAFRAPTFA